MSSGDKSPIADIFCELFEVAINCILYARKLYPDSIFERRRKYGVGVYQCIHPDVNEYIKETLKAVNFHLKKRQLKHAFLCFHSRGKLIERVHCDIIHLGNTFDSDPFLVQCEKFLRDFCIKLQSSLNYMEDLPEDSTFSIQLEITEYSSVEFNHQPIAENFPWVTLQNKEVELFPFEIVPLHATESNLLHLQFYIERSSK